MSTLQILTKISKQKILKPIIGKKKHLTELEKAKGSAVKDIQGIIDDLFQKK